jgi:flavodoxin
MSGISHSFSGKQIAGGVSVSAGQGRTINRKGAEFKECLHMNSLVVVFSCHHHNTEKIAHAIASVLDAPVKTPLQVDPAEVRDYDLVGFGSGIYSARFHDSVLDLIGRIPHTEGGWAFLFSTFGAPPALFPGERLGNFITANHSAARELLQAGGYAILDEFSCPGFNTNSFLRFTGGLNKGRPSAEDLRRAEDFARNLKNRVKGV